MAITPPAEAAFLTTREVATHFGVDPKTVIRWVKTGRLRGYRTPGGRLRIPAEDVETALIPAHEDAT